MKFYLSLAVIATLGCAHVPSTPTPISLTSYAAQCVQVREVKCLVDDTLTLEACYKLVPSTINTINNAAGRSLFRFAGIVPAETAIEEFEKGVYVIGAGELPDGVIGLTKPTITLEHMPCIITVGTLLTPRLFKTPFGRTIARRVLTHEMLHALGFDHSDHLASILTPAVDTSTPEMSDFDITSLRAVYGPR